MIDIQSLKTLVAHPKLLNKIPRPHHRILKMFHDPPPCDMYVRYSD